MKNIIFLHGYGANKEDLMPLETYLRSSDEQNFIFLDAPYLLEMTANGRAWFEITSQHFMSLMNEESSESFEEYIPKELDSSVDLIAKLIIENEKFEESKPSILVGFSQGSMCAQHVLSKYQKALRIEKVGLLSSHLVAKSLLDFSNIDPTVKFFQSHGAQDPVLSLERGLGVRDFLKDKNLTVDFHEFQGGHAIPLEVLSKLKLFLS